jgi:hypothetical protein
MMRAMLAAAGAAFLGVNCGEAPLAPTLAGAGGSYEAITYLAGPVGEEPTDLLSKGLTWTLLLQDDGLAYSTMNVVSPQTGFVTNHPAQPGGVTRAGDILRFRDFDGHRFLTERTWTFADDHLESVGQVVDGIRATIRFARR